MSGNQTGGPGLNMMGYWPNPDVQLIKDYNRGTGNTDYLFRVHMDVRLGDETVWTAVHEAIERRDFAGVFSILETRAGVSTTANPLGTSLIKIALGL